MNINKYTEKGREGVAAALKMIVPVGRRRPLAAAPFIVMAFAAVGLLRWPLLPVVLLLAPFSFALAWWRR